jgi:D-alanyl-lipoteichoic acid acyltransferase DltB (MBOAT superfamily)
VRTTLFKVYVVLFADRPFFVFLPLVLLGYHLLRARGHKFTFLLVASWVFYAWASPGYLWVIVALTVVDYAAALRIAATDDPRRRKWWLTLSVVSNLGLLAAFKYAAFAVDSGISLARLCGYETHDRMWDILLPLGISFHTFQGISYTVDVYRRRIRAVTNFRDYALFVTFFPQLAAGPIVRAVEFLPQMVTPPKVTAGHVEAGLRLFVGGLFKKLFIADYLHLLIVDPVFSNPAAYDAAAHRWAAVAWAVQIYCDFSGYTDMAVGVAKWFGFDLPPNFHLPYLAVSITDFWRRWHISLSSWLRDYLYFPLGGSRGGAVRTYANLLLVFVLCGLWHGAAWHWLVYGLYNGVLMGLHRAFDRSTGDAGWRKSGWWATVAWAATSYQLVLGLVLIRMTGWDGGLLILQSLAGFGYSPTAAAAALPLVAVAALMALGLAGHVFETVSLPATGFEWPTLRGLGYAAAVVLLVAVGPGATKGFIYIAF